MRKFSAAVRKRLVPLGLASLAAGALFAPFGAQATPVTPYIVTLSQQGGNVVANGSGEFDLSGLTYEGLNDSGGQGVIWPSNAEVAIGTGFQGDLYETSSSFAGPANFGTGGGVDSTGSGTGDLTALVPADALVVPLDYVSGTALSGGATWDNATFASLGVTPGVYQWTWGSAADQSFTLDVALPEPAEWGMFGIGLLLIGGLVTLRRHSLKEA